MLWAGVVRVSAESTAPTRNTANVSRQAGAWGCTGRGRGHQPLADVSQSETSSDSDSDTVTDLEASGSDMSDTPDDTGNVQLPSSSSRRLSMSQQLQRRQTRQPHPMAMPASMWDPSTVWAGNIAIVRRTDTAVGARVLV